MLLAVADITLQQSVTQPIQTFASNFTPSLHSGDFERFLSIHFTLFNLAADQWAL